MGWFRKRRRRERATHSPVRRLPGGAAAIDVRGQTGPGYRLAINRALDELTAGTEAHLLVDDPPCGADLKAWTDAKGCVFLGLTRADGAWEIRVRK